MLKSIRRRIGRQTSTESSSTQIGGLAAPAAADCPATLLDPELEARFRSDGYVVVDFLDAEGLETLRALCSDLYAEPQAPWQSSFFDPDLGRRRAAYGGIEDAFREPIRERFVEHHSILHSLILNWPGPDGGLQLHQHSSVVDESQHRSALVWCPLDDSSEENGTLHLVPRSHLLQVGPKPERSASWLESHEERLLDQYLVALPVQAGQAVVFDNQLIHCSFPNHSRECRRTVVAAVLPNAAVPHYYDPGDGHTAMVYRLEPEFLIENQSVDLQLVRPDGLELLDKTPWSVPNVAREDLDALEVTSTCSHLPSDA